MITILFLAWLANQITSGDQDKNYLEDEISDR